MIWGVGLRLVESKRFQGFVVRGVGARRLQGQRPLRAELPLELSATGLWLGSC